MPIINVNGVRINIEDTGEGPPLILLHGLGGSNLYWKSEITQLKEHHRVIAPDSRGQGKSEKVSNYTLCDHINDTLAIIDKLNIKSCFLLGISAGSYIAQGVAIAAPNRVKKLILVAPKSHGDTSSTQLFFEKHRENIKGLNEQEKQKYLYKHIYYNQETISKSPFFAAQEQLPVEQFEAANRALIGFDFRSKLSRITAKTLVVSGRHDILNSSDAGRECATLIPNATFIEMDKSGHGPNVEEPEHFMKIVKNFLKD
ncbi:alpha/beta hydrolase [Bacillus sp. JJ1533]|uniref:alpha/beta fold hydrolase n=1 Tax=Bacillus sp. JJ1533 TaxID=3122959 RepID=UPI002FFE571C